MTGNTAAVLPLGPLDPERGALLSRLVDGLDAPTLQWLSGFAAGVAYARSGAAAVIESSLPAAAGAALPSVDVGRLVHGLLKAVP